MNSPHPKSNHIHVPTAGPSSQPANLLAANRRQHQSVRQKKRIDNLAVDGCYCPLCMR